MIQLSREIRFALVSAEEFSAQPKPLNSWASWPSTSRIVPYLTLKAIVEGTPDPVTGYLCNIKIIDDLLREAVGQILIPELENMKVSDLPPCAQVLKMVFDFVEDRPIQSLTPAKITNVSLAVSPYLNFSIDAETPSMVNLTQQFEFSAAHRLHCDELSDEENRSLFGKCNNPAGHGHNYVVEVTICKDPSKKTEATDQAFDLPKFESIVKSEIIDRLDHKHLNKDIEYFSKTNPSVENISVAIWNWLVNPLLNLDSTKLVSVKVFETPKTWAMYRGN